VRELTARLQRESIRLEVHPGGELSYELVERLDRHQLDLIAQGPAGQRWVLLEGRLSGLGADFTTAADRLRALGFGILLAHPERYPPSAETIAAIELEIAAGTALQFNGCSFTGGNGPEAQARAFDLLSRAPSAVVSSDAHGPERPPVLREALSALASAGVPDPERLAWAAPRALLERGLRPRAVAAAA
jgi:protein-tyrosine phosphatase